MRIQAAARGLAGSVGAICMLALCGCAVAPVPGYEAFVERDFDTACRELDEGASRGNSAAIYYLGFCYEDGLGGYPRQKDRAIALWDLAARMGYAAAGPTLAKRGLPVPSPILTQERGAQGDHDSNDVAGRVTLPRPTRPRLPPAPSPTNCTPFVNEGVLAAKCR